MNKKQDPRKKALNMRHNAILDNANYFNKATPIIMDNIEKIIEKFLKEFSILEFSSERSFRLNKDFLYKALTNHTLNIRKEIEGMRNSLKDTGGMTGHWIAGQKKALQDTLDLDILKVKK